MKPGDRVQIRAYKGDGTCYRWWHGTVESAIADQVVVVTPVGHRVHGLEGWWASKHSIRAYHWSNRWYSLLEAYAADGRLVEIYVNISSPSEIANSVIRFTDYELDVSRQPPQPARLVDEDEFAEAVVAYGYTETFQIACYRVAREALALADGWVAGGMPDVDG
jgi:protein associated with RNAse G/E